MLVEAAPIVRIGTKVFVCLQDWGRLINMYAIYHMVFMKNY